MDLQLCGAIPANVMPFTADGAIDEAAYRRHIDWLVTEGGAAGITSNGHAAEVTSLSRDERRRAIAMSAEVIAGRVPLVAGVHAESSDQAIVLARDAVAEGADALLVFPLNVMQFGGSPEMAKRHFQAIEEALAVPQVLFMYPQWTGMHYNVDTLVDICVTVPSVVAVKEWSLDIRAYEQNLNAVRSLDRPVAMLSSFSTNLLPSLILGADGILSGHGSVVVDLQRHLLDAVEGEDLPLAREFYRRIQVLTPSVYRHPLVDMYTRMKEQLVMLGRLDCAAARSPLLPLSPNERAELRDALVSAGLLASGS